MSALELSYEACVRSLSRAASCTKCKEACPEGAITLDGPRGTTAVHLGRCTECGLCAAACPTDAFAPPFDVAAWLDAATAEVRCGHEGLTCVGALATEDLITLAQRHRRLTVHDGRCAARSPGHAHAATRIEEANRALDALGLRARITWQPDEALEPPADRAPPPPLAAASAEEQVSVGRRRLLRMLVPPLETRPKATLQIPDRLDRAKMGQVPARRRRMLAALPASVEARTARLPADQVTFFSSKDLSAEACTACAICVSVCPTGALQAPRSLREIRFDTSRCTKCGLCHDVCEPDAITLAEEASLEQFLDFAPRRLSTIRVRPCGECGASFRPAAADGNLCPRCQDLEDEALELSGARP